MGFRSDSPHVLVIEGKGLKFFETCEVSGIRCSRVRGTKHLVKAPGGQNKGSKSFSAVLGGAVRTNDATGLETLLIFLQETVVGLIALALKYSIIASDVVSGEKREMKIFRGLGTVIRLRGTVSPAPEGSVKLTEEVDVVSRAGTDKLVEGLAVTACVMAALRLCLGLRCFPRAFFWDHEPAWRKSPPKDPLQELWPGH